MFGTMGKLIGSTVGMVGGFSAALIAEVLDLPVQAVKEAIKEGCSTYEEIREFCEDEF